MKEISFPKGQKQIVPVDTIATTTTDIPMNIIPDKFKQIIKGMIKGKRKVFVLQLHNGKINSGSFWTMKKIDRHNFIAHLLYNTSSFIFLRRQKKSFL
jgi:hypothetical protein